MGEKAAQLTREVKERHEKEKPVCSVLCFLCFCLPLDLFFLQIADLTAHQTASFFQLGT